MSDSVSSSSSTPSAHDFGMELNIINYMSHYKPRTSAEYVEWKTDQSHLMLRNTSRYHADYKGKYFTSIDVVQISVCAEKQNRGICKNILATLVNECKKQTKLDVIYIESVINQHLRSSLEKKPDLYHQYPYAKENFWIFLKTFDKEENGQ